MIKHVTFWTRHGQFDFCSQKLQWCLTLAVALDDGSEIKINQIFDEEPPIDGYLPTDVIDLIEQELESYLISTSRAEKKQQITWLRANAYALNRCHLRTQLDLAEKKVADLRRQITDLDDEENDRLTEEAERASA